MTITFNSLPVNLRLPGTYVEIDGSQATSTTTTAVPQRILLIGHALTGTPSAAAPGVPVAIFDADHAASLAGLGSMLHHMARTAQQAAPTIPLVMLPVAPAAGATASTTGVTFTGSVNSAATINLHVGGRPYSVAASATGSVATPAAIATALMNAYKGINGTPPYYTMDWQYTEAGPGNIALTGEVNLAATREYPETALGADGQADPGASEFVIGVAFSNSAAGAATAPDGEEMVHGRPAGSAMPLGWSHAEYLSLVRSARDGVCFDRVEPAFQRYVVGAKRDCSHEIWTPRHRTRNVVAGRRLRLIFNTPGRVVWSASSNEGGAPGQHAVEATCLPYPPLCFCDLDVAALPVGTGIEWTFQPAPGSPGGCAPQISQATIVAGGPAGG